MYGKVWNFWMLQPLELYERANLGRGKLSLVSGFSAFEGDVGPYHHEESADFTLAARFDHVRNRI